jgi:hypothetical protein
VSRFSIKDTIHKESKEVKESKDKENKNQSSSILNCVPILHPGM